MSIESNGTFHRTLTIAALMCGNRAPLAATATPSSGMSSGGGSGHVSSGGFGGARPPGAGTLMRPSGGDPSMRQAWNPPAESDHKRRYRRNYDWTWFNKEPPCNDGHVATARTRDERLRDDDGELLVAEPRRSGFLKESAC